MPSPTMEEDTVIERAAPSQKRSSRARPPRRRWLARAVVIASAGIVVVSLVTMIALVFLAQNLPELRTLNDYHPPQATVVYGAKGEVVARFATERRTVVPYDRIPKIMVSAVIAAEDSGFFEHQGLDYMGIVRCALKNVMSGRKACGASTITQQTVKTFFLDPQKTYVRKIREMILSKRLEEVLSKDDILFLYLNQIYFGHGAHGVQEAARVYFAKDVGKLDVEEAALLAGLPQAPSILDPFKNPDRALKRRLYVLGRMHELGMIDDATFARTKEAPLVLADREDEAGLDNASHFAAHVRTLLTEKLGEERTLSGGLEVQTGLDPALQAAAEEAVRTGLRELDKRQGWRGPIVHLDPNQAKRLREALENRRALIGAKRPDDKPDAAPLIYNLARLESERIPQEVDPMAQAARFPRLALERTYAGIVIEVDDPGKEAVVDLGGAKVHLPLRTGLSWARKMSLSHITSRPRVPSEVLATGDVVLVRPTVERKDSAASARVYVGVLEQTPKVEAALVSIDPATREVRALVGGYGVGAGTFNRAIQARRQAGSTFKPLVYAAAFQTERFTPVTKCLDAPRVYRDPWTGRSWKPENYGKKFDGEISLRTALTLSKNLCSVQLIDEVGVDGVLDMAARAGIASPLPRNLTLALGSGDVTPLEMVNAYAALASGGKRTEPVFIRKIVAPGGEVLFQSQPTSEQTIRPEVAYQITSLMQSVVEDGTAQRVKALERPVAGKTGTTNESRNAWFIGFTPDLVAGVWVGFDNNDPLGPHETGGRAAIPIWLDYMSVATRDQPVRDFAAPAGIVFALVDPKTGKLATADFAGAKNEPFIAGTEPAEMMDLAPPPDRMMWEDY